MFGEFPVCDAARPKKAQVEVVFGKVGRSKFGTKTALI